jgi:hypothetical protein
VGGRSGAQASSGRRAGRARARAQAVAVAAPAAGVLVGGVAREAGARRGAVCEPQYSRATDVLVGERSGGTAGVRQEQRRPFSSHAYILLPPSGPPAPSSSPSLQLPAAELELQPHWGEWAVAA